MERIIDQDTNYMRRNYVCGMLRGWETSKEFCFGYSKCVRCPDVDERLTPEVSS